MKTFFSDSINTLICLLCAEINVWNKYLRLYDIHKAAVLSSTVEHTRRELTLELQQSSLSIVIKFDLGLA